MSFDLNTFSTGAERIDWILLHPDFANEVYTRTSHILDAHLHIELYRTLRRAELQYAKTIRYIAHASAPRSKKDKALRGAETAQQECMESALHLMQARLDTLLVHEALDDLYPAEEQDTPRPLTTVPEVAEEQVEPTPTIEPAKLTSTVEPVEQTPVVETTHITMPLLLDPISCIVINQEETPLFSFVPAGDGDHLFGDLAPWRLIRKKPDGTLLLVHQEDFPEHYPTGVLRMKLLLLKPTLPDRVLEAMCLCLDDTIARFLDVKATVILPEQYVARNNVYYDEPYLIVLDEPQAYQEAWRTISTSCTLNEMVNTIITNLLAQSTYDHLEDRVLMNLPLPANLPLFRRVARDLAFPRQGSPLAAIKVDSVYVIRTSTGELIAIESSADLFTQVIHSLHTYYGDQRLGTLHNLIQREPQETSFMASILPIVANIALQRYTQEGGKIVLI